MAPSTQQAKSQLTYYRTAAVNGRKVFYREAGDPGSPAIVLLHGLPTSSQMFRELIPALANQFHLIAPDYIGFGHSDAPSRSDFEYTFDNLQRMCAVYSINSVSRRTSFTCRTTAAPWVSASLRRNRSK